MKKRAAKSPAKPAPTNDVDKIRQANVRNILAKLKDGKTISRAEQSQVEEYYNGQAGPVKQADLQQLWGLSKGRISQMVALGMPLDSLAAAEAWRQENIRNAAVDRHGHSKADLECQRLILDNQIREIRLARERRDSVDTATAKDFMGRVVEVQKKAYRSMASWYAVRFALSVGDRGEAEKKWAEVEQRISENVRNLVEEF